MKTLRRVLIAAALFALASRLPAAESGSSGPAIFGLTVIFENIAPGFLSSRKTSGDMLTASFFVHIGDLAAHIDSIKGVRVEDEAGTGWAMDVPQYKNVAKNYIGGYGRWYNSDLAIAPASLLPLKYTVIITLTDGKTVKASFEAPSPIGAVQPQGASSPPRFLINAGFPGTVTPYHISAPNPPAVRSAYLADKKIRMTFSGVDRRITNGRLNFYDDKGANVGSTPYFRVDSINARWLNGGSPLRSGMELNEIEYALADIAWTNPAAENRNLSAVSLEVTEDRPAESNLLRVQRLFIARTGMLRINGSAGSAVTLLQEDARKRVEEAARTAASAPISPAWKDDRASVRAWETALPGILNVLDKNGFGALAPFADTTANKTAAAASVKSGWGATDRKSLLEALSWLKETGHSAKYAAHLKMLDENPGVDDAKLASLSADVKLTAEGFAFARQFRTIVGKKGLRAWDLCRLINLARLGYALGYIGEEEAWKWIDESAAVLRDTCSSWMDLGNQFMLGRMFWGGNADAGRLYLQASGAMTRLMTGEGQWTKLPWPPKSAADSSFNQDLQ